ncbi:MULTISPECIES: substrate-binding domain-containing protein [unclassified Halanaerobium]|uniref:substrate-binding domain-containing protein n=1 Tax=unclassified Halanaerobium TaxID=2641197 RepID=UPI000DF2CEB1|nr:MULTISPECIES: substrate-binding domain-containing protein [unclassified Halanaerobium]RCW50654.1 tungstate transport system substrate-binding protein [Halanaerobium sp. MA284_MarDTE_T2]RCW86822.1 tungstate transport system substrate-binding protein [Halanaerobium sp. DL-01]
MNKKLSIFLIILMITLVFSGMALAQDRLILATTTSTENSGLLDEILPTFEEKFDVRVDVIAVGTGRAISLAENGDADIILVHARAAEDAFVEAGYGVNRRDVMYNDFVILGPADDPAGVKGMESAVAALEKIANSESNFISRGDDSGTHKKELSLWEKASVKPSGSWYMETGQGMGASINVANEKEGYILADRGTFLAYSGDIDLELLVSGDPLLFNPYGIIPVNPAYHTHVNYQKAMALVGYITSQEGQQMIYNYTKYGERLFNPSAITPENFN